MGKKQIGVKLAPEQLGRLDAYAAAQGVPRTRVIELGIEEVIRSKIPRSDVIPPDPALRSALLRDLEKNPDGHTPAPPKQRTPQEAPRIVTDDTESFAANGIDFCSDPDCHVGIRHARH